jgi:hypothetical protein
MSRQVVEGLSKDEQLIEQIEQISDLLEKAIERINGTHINAQFLAEKLEIAGEGWAATLEDVRKLATEVKSLHTDITNALSRADQHQTTAKMIAQAISQDKKQIQGVATTVSRTLDELGGQERLESLRMQLSSIQEALAITAGQMTILDAHSHKVLDELEQYSEQARNLEQSVEQKLQQFDSYSMKIAQQLSKSEQAQREIAQSITVVGGKDFVSQIQQNQISVAKFIKSIKWILGFSVVAVLLSASLVGWWGYTHYIAPIGSGLKGEYFVGENLNLLVRTRIDSRIDFGWMDGSPNSAIPADHFSVRWSGQIRPPITGKYTIITKSDDGIRLWLDGQLVIDNWSQHSTTQNAIIVELQGKQMHRIRLEYFESTEKSALQLLWSGPGIQEQIIDKKYLFPD